MLTYLTDLALAVTQSAAGQEFHILLIMIVLVIAVFFCHSVIRLCIQLLRPEKDASTHRVPEIAGVHGYAQPDRPIPVHLARDEELALEANTEDPDKPRIPPPAYGLWRSSVVSLLPNLLH